MSTNQLLILSEIRYPGETQSALLGRLSSTYSIPLSTLRLHAHELKELGLIGVNSAKSDYNVVELTEGGRQLMSLIGASTRDE